MSLTIQPHHSATPPTLVLSEHKSNPGADTILGLSTSSQLPTLLSHKIIHVMPSKGPRLLKTWEIIICAVTIVGMLVLLGIYLKRRHNARKEAKIALLKAALPKPPIENSTSIEKSIVPVIEHIENPANLQAAKYSKNQFTVISNALQRKAEKIRIVSFNVLRNDGDDRIEEAHKWPQRLPRVVKVLEEMNPDVIGIQELCQSQLNDLMPVLENKYSFFGKPRQSNAEVNGIFYRKDRFETAKQEVHDIPHSKNTVVMVQLKDKLTSKNFALFNTHLSYGPPEAREGEVQAILDKMKPVAQQIPVMLSGDMNLFPNRPDMTRLPFFDGDYAHRLLTADLLKDSHDISVLGHLGPIGSYTNDPSDILPFKGYGSPGVKLDRIYVSNRITPLIHAIQPATINGKYPSDHMPLLVDCLLD